MELLTQMNCPACGSPALVQESVTTLRCENCNSVVQRSTSTTVLEVLGIGCYSCGAVNDKGIKFCTNCGTELIVDCPSCKRPIVLGQKKCGKCGIDILENYVSKVENLEKHIEEKNIKISHNEAIIEEKQLANNQSSIMQPKTIIGVLVFSLLGSIIITAMVSGSSGLPGAYTLIGSVCLVIPIFAGIMMLISLSTGSQKAKLEKEITHANNENNQINKEITLLKEDITIYQNYSKAYESIRDKNLSIA